MRGNPNSIKAETGRAAPLWQSIYCSLALIMVVLFVMLVSYSTFDRNGLRSFQSNLRQLKPPTAQQKAVDAHPSAKPLDVGDGRSPTVLRAAYALKERLEGLGLGKDLKVERTHRGFKAVVAGHILFPAGSAVISTGAYPFLDEMIRVAQKTGAFIKIEGHADSSIPTASGQDMANWELSVARATGVLRYFLEKGGIPLHRLAAAGFGRYHSVASNGTTEGRTQNRRIEVFFTWVE